MKTYRKKWIAGIILIYPILFCLANKWGIVPHHGDAKNYLAAAQSLMSSNFTELEGQFYYFPILFPTLLAVFLKFFPPKFAILYLNALVYTIFAYRIFLDYMPKTIFFRVICVLSLIFSHILFKISIVGISEIVFLAFVTLIFWQSRRYFRDASWINLVGLALLVSLAILTRYVGLILVFSFGFMLFYHRKYKHLFPFIAISILPISIWFTRNYVLFKTISGGHTDLVFTALKWEIIPMITRVLALWTTPFIFWNNPNIHLLFFLLIVGVYSSYIAKDNYFVRYVQSKRLPELTYVLLYLLMIIAIVRPDYNALGRILIPILPYILLSYIFLGEYLYLKYYKNKLINYFLIFLYAFWGLQILRNILTHFWVRHFGLVHFSIFEWFNDLVISGMVFSHYH